MLEMGTQLDIRCPLLASSLLFLNSITGQTLVHPMMMFGDSMATIVVGFSTAHLVLNNHLENP